MLAGKTLEATPVDQSAIMLNMCGQSMALSAYDFAYEARQNEVS
jgi:hypothetical protein